MSKREILKNKIIESAHLIVIKNGYENLTARNIANHAGCAVGSLYSAYENIDEIVFNINNNTLNNLYLHLLDSIDIKELILRYVKFSISNANEWDLLLRYNMQDKTKITEQYKKTIDNIFKLVQKKLAVYNNLSATEIPHLARVIWSGVHGLCSLHYRDKLSITNSGNISDLVDYYISFIINGIENNQ